jgi:hypothetical protein
VSTGCSAPGAGAGTAASPSPSPPPSTTAPVEIHGHVAGGLSAVSGAYVQLYAMGTQGMESAATPVLSVPVVTDTSGNFTISGSYKCPATTSELYLVATGGNPGLAVGTNNPALALMTLLGECSSLSPTAVYPINEVTTIGTIWPLADYMVSAAQVGGNVSDSSFSKAIAEINQEVNLGSAVSPGAGIPAGYAVQTAKLYTLAGDLHGCIVSMGGTAGDGSACGQLFSLTTAQGRTAPANTINAALQIAKNNELSVDGLFDLPAGDAPFAPVLPESPVDWNLDLVAIPAPPTILPVTGEYAAGQAITLSSTVTGAAIHYTVDGTAPSASSPLYTAPLALPASEVVQAISMVDDITSSVAIATFSLAPSGSLPVPLPITIAITPATVTLAPGQTQQFAAVVAGADSSGVTWSLSPAEGAISATGLYTAPASITGLQNIVVTATSQAGGSTPASAAVSLAPNGAANTIFYVDNVQGNDANNGTSAATAFATVAKINSLSLQPGQTVAFKAGNVWHEVLTVAQSGTGGLAINYTSYGDGVQPVIDASDTVTGWTQVGSSAVWSRPQATNPLLIDFAGQTGTPVVSAAAITSPNQFAWDGSTLFVYATSNPTPVVEIASRRSALTSPGASFITVTNLELRGGTDTVYCGVADPCAHWDFESNTVDSGYGIGLRFVMNMGVSAAGLVVNNNTFRGTGGSGIGLSNGGAAMGDLITNNTMTDLCKVFVAGSPENEFCDAINLYSQTTTDGGGLIKNNTISEVGLTSGAAYGGGIHPDTVVNWDIENNTITNTNYPGINLEKGSGSTARYNLLVSAGQYQYFSGLFIRAGDGMSVTNMLAEFNTVVGGWWSCALLIDQNAGNVTATNVSLSKNICTGSSSGTQLWLDRGFGGNGDTFAANGFGLASPAFVSMGGTAYGSYLSLPSPVVGSLDGNPTFVNPVSGNYRLQATSPDLGIGAFPQP